MNEYVHDATDQDVLGLIVECTGGERDSASTKYTLATLNMLRRISDFDTVEGPDIEPLDIESKKPFTQHPAISSISQFQPNPPDQGGKAISLSYTINLNLPATKDIEVFNAIFKSLKEHILGD